MEGRAGRLLVVVRKTVEGRLYRRMRDVSYFGAQPK
jgi:hypothetical protein